MIISQVLMKKDVSEQKSQNSWKDVMVLRDKLKANYAFNIFIFKLMYIIFLKVWGQENI